ncbi:hypothetical protein AB5I41_26430 [Sphingomonas sp. MMS24-JH45]
MPHKGGASFQGERRHDPSTSHRCGLRGRGGRVGLAYLAAAGAPARYLALNVAALEVGLVLLALAGRARMGEGGGRRDGGGARRGDVGGGCGRGRSALAAARRGVGAAEPDPAAGHDRALCLTPHAAGGRGDDRDRGRARDPARSRDGGDAGSGAGRDRGRGARSARAGAARRGGGGVRGDAGARRRPAAVPHVDGILTSAFDVHPLAGAAVLGGSALLLLPAVLGWRFEDERAVHVAFGAAWIAAIAAAALGNYPTPIVGYGGSAIIGYLPEPRLPRVVAAAGTAPAGEARAVSRDAGALRLSVR